MSIYNKYVINILIPVLFFATVMVTSIVWIVQTMNLSRLLDKGVTLTIFLKLTFLLLPYFIFIIMPIVSVLSVIFIYHKLQEERQVVVLRGAGFSDFSIAKPALYLSVIVTLIVYYISLHLMPISYNSLKSNLSNFKENYVSNIISERAFNQISKYNTLYIEKKQRNNSFEGVILFDNKKPQKRTIFFAKSGKIKSFSQNSTEFELFSGVRHSYDKYGNITKLYFDNISINVTGKNISSENRKRSPLELFIHEMIWPDSELSLEKQNRLVVDGHIRLIWPLCNFAFVFLAISIFLKFPFTRQSQLKQYVYTFLPVIVAIYLHFTLQKMSYHNVEYIVFCYLNVFLCIIIAVLQSVRGKL
ncbi:MAG: hypothetical protein DGJ47_000729 [Rickettsiaceae bacterium]